MKHLVYDLKVEPSYGGDIAIQFASAEGLSPGRFFNSSAFFLFSCFFFLFLFSSFFLFLLSNYFLCLGHTDIVRVLLSDKNVNPPRMGNIALRVAIEAGHIEVVKLLLTGLLLFF